jgi:hypothetical protein
MKNEGTLAVFSAPVRAAGAVRALRAAGHRDLRVTMPAPFPALVEALELPTSRLGWITLAGAIGGTVAGFALCIGTSLAWPLVTGGKPIVSLPPFVIIAFEAAVLLGALVTLAGLGLLLRLGRRRRAMPYDERFSADRIGVFVPRASAAAEQILREHGAEEVRHVA